MTRDIPNVVRVLPPTGGEAPVVLDSPHSGTVFPADFGHAAPASAIQAGCDAFVDELFGAGPALGAAMIAAEFPRAYIDPNRALDDLDPDMLDGLWPEPLTATLKTAAGKGLIWRTGGGGVPIYDRKLRVAEVAGRIENYWRPYNDTLASTLEGVHARWGGYWHIDCHSMPSVWSSAASHGAGTAVEADFILGDRDGTTCEPAFTELVRDTLTKLGWRVAVNDRFKGVEIVRRQGQPAENRHSLQIEIVRRGYLHEKTLAPNEGYARMQRDLTSLLETVCDWARRRAPAG